MTIDAAKYDFVNNIEDTKHVLGLIYERLFFYNKISPKQYTALKASAQGLTVDDIPITH